MGTDAEELIACLWAGSSLVGGLVCLRIRAYGAALALLGSLLGGLLGFVVGVEAFPAVGEAPVFVPMGMIVGATIGVLLGGMLGLTRGSRASRTVLMALGVFVLFVGLGGLAFLTLGQNGALQYGAPGCRPRHSQRCFAPDLDGWATVVFALDAMWVAFLCFFQAAQASRANRQQALA